MDAAAYFNLGNLFLLTHQYERSGQWLEKGLSRQPDSAFGHFLQGSLYESEGRTQEAWWALRRCLELDPLFAKAHLALVNVYQQERRTGDAVIELRLFLRYFPDNPLAPKAREVLTKLYGPPECVAECEEMRE